MKKEYIKPSMEAIEIHQSQILCQSANAAHKEARAIHFAPASFFFALPSQSFCEVEVFTVNLQ